MLVTYFLTLRNLCEVPNSRERQPCTYLQGAGYGQYPWEYVSEVLTDTRTSIIRTHDQSTGKIKTTTWKILEKMVSSTTLDSIPGKERGLPNTGT